MATKLRKFSYSLFLKVIVFLLTAGSIAMTGKALFDVIFANASFLHNYNVNYDYVENFESSLSFAEMINQDISRIEEYMQVYHGDDEYVKSGKAWDDYEAQLRADCKKDEERSINGKIKYYMNNYSVYDIEDVSDSDSGDTDAAEHSTAAYSDFDINSSEDGNTENIYTLENAKKTIDEHYYKLLENEIVSIRSNSEDRLNKNLANKRQSFFTRYEELKKEIEGLVNFKFIYDDGTFFKTNIEGVEKKADKNYTQDISRFPFAVSPNGMVINDGSVPTRVSSIITEYGSFKKNIAFGINTDFSPDDKYYDVSCAYSANYQLYTDSILFGSIGIFGTVLGIIYLMITAGRKDKNSPVEQASVDRCFHDIHFVITAALISITVISGFARCNSLISEPDNAFGIAYDPYIFTVVVFVCAVFLLEWLMSFARAVKLRTLIKHSLWFVIGKKIIDFFRKCFEKIRTYFTPKYHFNCLKKSVVFKLILFFAANAVFFLFGLISFDSGSFGFFILLFLIPACVFNIVFFMKNFETIKNLDMIFTEIRKGSQGDFNFSLDYSKMEEPVKGFAVDVENMKNGLKTAVNEAIKGERMKTELITNVSHDLKTPLTSIINYVDLLGRCNITDETAKEYIGVLSDKSEKLKKLIEDLVEASKASTGNIKITKIKMDLYELAVQAVGEHEDTLAERGIEVRINTPEKQPVVLADNQKTWRIIDNLFSNVKKYSLKGSRAYITVDEKDGWGRFSIKNISEKALDISPDELIQRFVRGDSARSTEGSGLGLSIAKSLCELQGGRFKIEIDGDLFKATVELPIASENEETNKKSILEEKTIQGYPAQSVNLNASFNLPPDLKVSEQMAEELKRRQIEASHNFKSSTDINEKNS